MKKTFVVIIFFYLAAVLNPVKAETASVAGISAVPSGRFEKEKPDPRINRLAAYLEMRKSPLVNEAETFIKMADKYGLDEFGLDYLVAAICGVESSFGKHYPQGSYNAYGWNSGNFYWDSWKESIEHVTRVLRSKYIDRGADTVSKIGPIYAESPTWASRVSFFINQIENYENLHDKLVLDL